MGLFRISRELQFSLHNNGEPCASPHTARERDCFHREEKGIGRAVVNRSPWFFIGCILARKEKSFFFQWDIVIISVCVKTHSSTLPSLFN